jgi:hypothetical protein
MLPNMIRSIFTLMTSILVFSGTVHAQEPKEISTHGAWAAYSYKADGGTVCYIISQPTKSEPANVRRDPIHFLVTHRTKGKSRNEVNTIIGYPFKKSSLSVLRVDGSKFEMFTNGDGAWLDSKTKDRQVVVAMKRGSKMTINGTSWRGTKTSDSYSLEGVTAAMDAIDKACK